MRRGHGAGNTPQYVRMAMTDLILAVQANLEAWHVGGDMNAGNEK